MRAPKLERHYPKVMRLLEAAAERGDPCPSNIEIAALIGGASMSSGTTCLMHLEKRGLIRVDRGNVNRKVTIVSTGKSTAGAVPKKHWRLGNAEKSAVAARKARESKSRPSDPTEPRVAAPEPEFTHREPCFYCGTRGDLGCKHRRPA